MPYLLWSWGTGHIGGTLSQQGIWHAKPHTSHTTPCLVNPTIKDVQWLHFVGAENVRTRNWCDLGFGCKLVWPWVDEDLFRSSWDNGDVGSWEKNNLQLFVKLWRVLLYNFYFCCTCKKYIDIKLFFIYLVINHNDSSIESVFSKHEKLWPV